MTVCLALIALLSLAGNAAAQQQTRVETELDRSEIARGETVTLRIRVHGQQGGVAIELDPLREQFEIVSTRSASHLRSVNNRIESWTDYMLVLFPRELGEQEIPPISVAGQVTEPYTITVTEPSTTGLASGQDVHMETVISKDSVYVQEQLLFTIRLYYTIAGIRNPNFTEVAPENTVVQLLGQPHQYEQLIDGQRYGVYEMNYVIFPQRSGEMEIPDIVFRGELTDGSSNFVFRNPNMRPVTAFAPGYNIEVKGRPGAFPTDSTWLPASDIRVEERWSDDITRLEPGQSVTRTLTITGNGLDGAALPPLGRPEIDRMNVYPEPPVIERSIIDGNVVGTRTEIYELVATENGSVVIPEINLPWWDVDTDSLRQAVVPASFIVVEAPGGAGADGDSVSTATDNAVPGNLLPPGTTDELLSSRQTPAWIIYGLLSVIVLILAVMWWFWQRRRPTDDSPGIVRTPVYERDIENGQEKLAFRQLESSLAAAEPLQLRQHLIAWGRQYYRDAGLHNLDDLSARFDNSELTSLCQKLQAVLYSSAADATFSAGDRQRLSSVLKAERSAHLKDNQRLEQEQNFALPPLYRQ
ncbi:MAG: BatD family protein [Pseudohongiella sp.]|uniref:BatD family protein n=1 Tax=Pseudohongiella sp. TaxID=1979412 RepID=UPI00349FF889